MNYNQAQTVQLGCTSPGTLLHNWRGTGAFISAEGKRGNRERDRKERWWGIPILSDGERAPVRREQAVTDPGPKQCLSGAQGQELLRVGCRLFSPPPLATWTVEQIWFPEGLAHCTSRQMQCTVYLQHQGRRCQQRVSWAMQRRRRKQTGA